MEKINIVYLLELLDASEVLDANQKVWWKNKIPTMTEVQVAQFFQLLEKEAKAENVRLRKILAAEKIYAHQKIKALYDYAERKIQEEEETELELLDKELANLPS